MDTLDSGYVGLAHEIRRSRSNPHHRDTTKLNCLEKFAEINCQRRSRRSVRPTGVRRRHTISTSVESSQGHSTTDWDSDDQKVRAGIALSWLEEAGYPLGYRHKHTACPMLFLLERLLPGTWTDMLDVSRTQFGLLVGSFEQSMTWVVRVTECRDLTIFVRGRCYMMILCCPRCSRLCFRAWVLLMGRKRKIEGWRIQSSGEGRLMLGDYQRRSRTWKPRPQLKFLGNLQGSRALWTSHLCHRKIRDVNASPAVMIDSLTFRLFMLQSPSSLRSARSFRFVIIFSSVPLVNV